MGGASLPEGSVRSVGDIPVCFVGAVLALTGGKSRAETTGLQRLRGYGRMPYPPTSV